MRSIYIYLEDILFKRLQGASEGYTSCPTFVRIPGTKEWLEKKALLDNKITKISLLSAGKGGWEGIKFWIA